MTPEETSENAAVCRDCWDSGVVTCDPPWPCGHGGHTCWSCTTCLAHLRRHLVTERCPECAAYISAGL